MGFSDCIDIYDDADPRDWNDAYDLPHADNVYERMEDAAHLHLLGQSLPVSIWDSHINNGIGR